MKNWNKIGVVASCVTLLGLFFSGGVSEKSGIYLAYFFKNSNPALIMISSGLCLFASKRDKSTLLRVGATICVIVVFHAFYNAASTVKMLSDGYDLLLSVGRTPDFDPPKLGFAWLFFITGSLGCLLAAAMTVEKWGIEARFQEILSKTGDSHVANKEITFSWNAWSLGGKMVFSAACLALLSFFLPWVDIGFTSRNGFSQGSFLLGALYIYPVYKLLTAQKGSRSVGIACAVISILLALIYISSKTVDIFGVSLHAASSGAEVFIVASIILGVGVWLRANELGVDEPKDSDDALRSPSPATMAVVRASAAQQSARVPCPQCAELVMLRAKVCRFCGANLGSGNGDDDSST